MALSLPEEARAAAEKALKLMTPAERADRAVRNSYARKTKARIREELERSHREHEARHGTNGVATNGP